MSCSVAAHLAKAASAQRLPELYARAQVERAKVIDLSEGEVRSCQITDGPTEVLKSTLAALERATFTGKGDKEVVKAQLLNFEWILETALSRSRDLAQYGTALTVDPRRPTIAVELVSQRRAAKGKARLLPPAEKKGGDGSDAAKQDEVEEVEKVRV